MTHWKVHVLILAIVATLVATAAPRLHAATFYVDPATGDMSNDGSAAHPWRTLAEVFSAGLIASKNSSGNPVNPGAPVTGGDTILLRSGYHGEVDRSDYMNDTRITVAAEGGHTPELRRLELNDFRNWTFSGLAISTELSPSFARVTLVELRGSTSNVTIQNCHIYSVDDVAGFSVSDWLNRTGNGISIRSSCHDVTLFDNTVRNVDHGILLSGTDLLARGNQVINFRGDGMRALNHNQTIEYNTIKNCYDVDDNHDDGIQCYKTGTVSGDILNMVVRGNVIINAEDPNQPLKGTLQGMGFFDGNHINFLIENNLVITDHWHGITILGAENSTIINNTVVNPRWLSGQSNLRTWIQIGANKDGTLATGCVIRNNIAHNFLTGGNVGLAYDHNLTVDASSVAGVFVDWQNRDFHLKAGSPAIDAGSPVGAPAIDIEGLGRPTGFAWDIGAYEFEVGPRVTGWAVAAHHGTAGEIVSPLADGGGEPRLAGPRVFQITFDRALDPATVVPGSVTISGAAGGDQSSLIQTLSLTSGDTVLTVTLSSALPDADRTTLAVTDAIRDMNGAAVGGDRDIRVNVLAGDADNSGTVGPADILAVRNQVGQTMDAATARYDIDGSGQITGGDLLAIRARLGSSLP